MTYPTRAERDAAVMAAYRRGDPVKAIEMATGCKAAHVCRLALRAGLRRNKVRADKGRSRP